MQQLRKRIEKEKKKLSEERSKISESVKKQELEAEALAKKAETLRLEEKDWLMTKTKEENDLAEARLISVE